MASKNRQCLMARKLILTIFVVVMMITSVSASITRAQESQTSGNRYGTIADIKNCKKMGWILSGG